MTSMPLDDGLKAAFGQIQDGTAFNRSFENTVGDMTGHISAIQTKVNTLPTQINGVSNDITAKARNVETQITSAATRIPQFADHIKNQFDNIMANASTFASSQGLKNALSGKSGGCSNMSDFFGSITTRGPSLLQQVKDLTTSVTEEIDRFKGLGEALQGNIIATKGEIITQLNAEIASAGADATRLTSLNALKATIQNGFQSAVAEERANMVAQAQGQLSTQRKAALEPLLRDMKVADFRILDSSNKINGIAGQIDSQTAELHGLIDKEKTTMKGAVTELEQLGAATGMRSLLNTNPCVQSLMGFVGNDSFLKNLGGKA